ncbi:YbaN family protein [Kaistia terrae]|uniref:YbaN family protein n=1 Tax=Kaistia terrae TaxID=537017 RepID=A0ABW0PS99_9HYPH|nr:YbaN family protein [Kaistia terrae]MCX5577503.1 YbaN family protein [Kaistia terrae]
MRAVLHASRRAGYVALGFAFVALGIIGAFLPVMPTTVFLILAAWSFGRSSPRLEAWMLNHPKFGGVIRDWREHGAVPRRVKYLACGGMAFGYAVFWLSAHPSWWLGALVALGMLACAIWISTRPEREASPPALPE